MTFDSTHYYRLTAHVSGKEYALEVSADGSDRVMLSEPADSIGQFWKLAPISDGRYALRTAYWGDGLSLAMDKQRSVCLRRPIPRPASRGICNRTAAAPACSSMS